SCGAAKAGTADAANSRPMNKEVLRYISLYSSVDGWNRRGRGPYRCIDWGAVERPAARTCAQFSWLALRATDAAPQMRTPSRMDRDGVRGASVIGVGCGLSVQPEPTRFPAGSPALRPAD